MKTQKLWTYDFTVITLGSVVSMVGSTLSGFAISLLVLDYTGSTFLYMLFIVSYQLPMLVCPILAGPYLDRMSRKKVIYRLDFLSSGMFLLLFLLLLRLSSLPVDAEFVFTWKAVRETLVFFAAVFFFNFICN